ncbi:MAG: hypothetical protein ACK5NK_07235 [Niabella sp.]
MPNLRNPKENSVEAWITTDLPNSNGVDFGGFYNVPGVIISVALYLGDASDVLELVSYKLDEPIAESVFKMEEVTAPCSTPKKQTASQRKDIKK